MRTAHELIYTESDRTFTLVDAYVCDMHGESLTRHLDRQQEMGRLVVVTDGGTPVACTSAIGPVLFGADGTGYFAAEARLGELHEEHAIAWFDEGMSECHIMLDRDTIRVGIGDHGPLYLRLARFALAETLIYIVGMGEGHDSDFARAVVPGIAGAVSGYGDTFSGYKLAHEVVRIVPTTTLA